MRCGACSASGCASPQWSTDNASIPTRHRRAEHRDVHCMYSAGHHQEDAVLVRMLKNIFSGRSPLPAPTVARNKDVFAHLPPLTPPAKDDVPTFHTPFYWSLRIPQLEFAAKVDQLK